MSAVLCSHCFINQGLKLDAERIGNNDYSVCPNCGERIGKKLNIELIGELAHRFFVWGTLHKCEYGAAPIVQFNEQQQTSIDILPGLEKDIELIEKSLGVGFFYYGPRMWMVGDVGPLQELQEESTRQAVIRRIMDEYPTVYLDESQVFYRIRKKPRDVTEISEYDTPPREFLGKGRFDSEDIPVMYCSQDLEVCLHECRVAAEDELFVATMSPLASLKILDLSHLLKEEHVTEFESLDMAVYMLFLAGIHSYDITRDIARLARFAGYDGIIYSSYFSMLRTGTMPFETAYGISYRRLPPMQEYEQAKQIPNLALFGRPLAEKKVKLRCINKLILSYVNYGFHFGPVGV
ncbi:RES family NAD+ phosphorylase [Prosthecochloris sp. SCSIO W1103]|uniref:RES family NAD+ phosphorylase n=1 Tax=Prosthecochloris sp. SCSIO W1103 TaxID=2992244 RepID=UPI00223D380C|nr:RES family NAD+ phosphorylase [Prosthecochloris sp. SCSIO W1103]UZJ37812.1 RES family NAD+ phosphorylase [Prosthecochloris sp. SCSIO W1103]